MPVSTIGGAAVDTVAFNGTGGLIIPTGTTAQRPTSNSPGQLRYNTTIGALEFNSGSAWTSLQPVGSIGNPATSISQLASQTITSGIYTFLVAGTTFTTYVEFNGPLGKTWVHIGTISDNNEGFQNAAAQIWSASLNPAQAAAPWDDTSTFGAQSFTADFKSGGWNALPFARWMVRDSGASLRNLFYSNVISSANTSFRAWWASQTWRASGSDTASAAVAAGRVTAQSGFSYGVSDPCNIGLRNPLLIKWGEFDGTQDGNKDRVMLSGNNPAAADGVDSPLGLGAFTGGTAGGPYYRDVVPAANAGDAPPNTITGAPLNYTFWVTD
jgi:hypothetical protein